MRRPIELDDNGPTSHDPEVIDAMRPFLETEIETSAGGAADAVAGRV
jgi:hypothetical protein